MPQIVPLDEASDWQPLLERAQHAVSEGKLVMVPDESGFAIIASSLSETGGRSLRNLVEGFPNGRQVLGIAHPFVLQDYSDFHSQVMDRLVNRCWPGPVAFRVPEPKQGSLLSRWPSTCQTWAQTTEGRSFYCPSGEFLSSLLSRIEAPALLFLTNSPIESLAKAIQDDIEFVVAAPPRFPELPTMVRFFDVEYEVEEEGVVSKNLMSRLSGEVFLFVCTGNTCRSPMAEGLFRKMLADRLDCGEEDLIDRGYAVLSAGLAASRGSGASPEAVELLRRDGIDISGHLSQPLTEELILHADRIFTMTRQHRQAILASFPELTDRVRTLSSRNSDISDPIGGGMEMYQDCRDEIAGFLNELIDQIPPRENRPD
ncbi:MAG: hypothetical protein KDA80_19920 [Planctomycetaceae bacterium]|nr:hypothetical protein [Planctomycetaceae bacterium]